MTSRCGWRSPKTRPGRPLPRRSREAKNFSTWPRLQNRGCESGGDLLPQRSPPTAIQISSHEALFTGGTMSHPLIRLSKAVETFNRIMYWLSAGAIVLSSLILTYEVVMRYLLQIPTIWEIESAIYLGVLATFMGAAYGLKDGAHIHIDFFVRALPPGAQRTLEKINSSLALLFCAYVAFKGWELFW